jgi:hypothetical protein
VKLQASFEILPTFAPQGFLSHLNASSTAKENKHIRSVPVGPHLICMAMLFYLSPNK